MALIRHSVCSSRAKSAFGDGRVFIEKYIENAQHIEFQVLAMEQMQCISGKVLFNPEGTRKFWKKDPGWMKTLGTAWDKKW